MNMSAMQPGLDPAVRLAAVELIRLARHEDLGDGDLTTRLLADPAIAARFALRANQDCVFAGREIAPIILAEYDPAISIDWTDLACDGSRVEIPAAHGAASRTGSFDYAVLATISGPLGPILSAERVLLNFLQRLCGVATLTRRFVDAVAGTSARIYDTRKTTPGWRALEKYAVRCGGGCNHRLGLFDAVLLKDNHLAGVPSRQMAAHVFDLLNRLEFSGPKPPFIEAEAQSLEQAEELFKVVGVNAVLLDNFNHEDLRRAVELRNARGLKGKVDLEASGGITLATVRSVAETAVERISVGAITHSATAVDLSLERI
jgi:nicotinate-nucleotide pyrophosphorylase (carboxylating)